MSEQKPEFSRVRRKKQNNKANKLLNWMIAIVVLLIVLVGVKILTSDSTPDKEQAAVSENASDNELNDDEDSADVNSNNDASVSDEEDSSEEGTVNDKDDDEDKDKENDKEKDKDKDKDEDKESDKEGTVTYSASEDSVVDETMTNTSWEPIGTSQSGNHVSQYDGASADWQEKQQALAYATGMSQDEMIFWKIKNGGSPQKSIGIVSSKDKSKKFRVYLEWVDGEGWKPTQMDILNTLDFKY
ncbi:YrrS family protein [Sporosarcina aquimarina]|uniref:YrrS family protein n=1 Tax=Sporosarcina aquimarina TaxID=114975 RepID=A0ABU4FWC5_9BACL|nr:YrrS family protein [Sporosarcina aquimarina]MDW0109017.1 YrrS family protein [Sporosarcina aquimarina]